MSCIEEEQLQSLYDGYDENEIMNNYKGKLYGKIHGVYYPLQETSEDIEKMVNKIKELEEIIKMNEYYRK